MIRFLLWAFVIYMLYRFVFDLVIPVAKTTRQVKKKVQQMQDAMQQQYQQQQQQQQAASQVPPTPSAKTDSGEYIDFEEIK